MEIVTSPEHNVAAPAIISLRAQSITDRAEELLWYPLEPEEHTKLEQTLSQAAVPRKKFTQQESWPFFFMSLGWQSEAVYMAIFCLDYSL